MSGELRGEQERRPITAFPRIRRSSGEMRTGYVSGLEPHCGLGSMLQNADAGDIGQAVSVRRSEGGPGLVG